MLDENITVGDLSTEVQPRHRKTYPQVWPAYNEAKTNEKALFLSLLRDLVEEVFPEERTVHQVGRPSLRFQDMLYAACVKGYSDYSSRIAVSELKVARKLTPLEKVPHFNTITNFLRKKSIMPMLKSLVVISALPLRSVEANFAIDSSGFTPDSRSFWMDVKFGTEHHDFVKVWKKVHLLSGTKTNVIANVEITDQSVGDSTMFKPSFENAARFFDIKEMTADKAYSSRAIIDQIMENGSKAYIPFKSNATGKMGGAIYWKQIYKEFKNNHDDFMRHYHQRSNAETTFSMMKRRLRERIRAKSDTGMINEILCRCVVHNITVLIQEMHELGVKVDFGDAKKFYTSKLVDKEPQKLTDYY